MIQKLKRIYLKDENKMLNALFKRQLRAFDAHLLPNKGK